MQFTALCRRLKLDVQRHDLRFGILTALTHNLNVTKGGKTAADFFPSLAEPKKKGKPGRPTLEQIRAGAKDLFGGFPMIGKR